VVNTTGIGFRFATVIANLGDGCLFLAPAVAELGGSALLAHMFLLLFAILSNVTPAVAIAGANPLTTGSQAARVAFIGFIIPYVWIYYPSLILVVDFQWAEFVWIMFRLPIAIWLIATAFYGHEFEGAECVRTRAAGRACIRGSAGRSVDPCAGGCRGLRTRRVANPSATTGW
jgi:hypothetical protein